MKTIRQKLLRKLWIISTPIALILLGCEPILDFLPRLPGRDAPVTEQPDNEIQAQSDAIAEMEAEIRQRINEIRQENGLNPLQNNERLAQVARDYSQKMAQEEFFSHTGPEGSTPAERVRNAGISFRVVGENLFKSTRAAQPASLAVEGWMNSPGHRENILRDAFTETGVGIWRDGNTYYITQLFMRPLF
ncbi:CAP domain-containing protein [Pleurocapsales cyanobacterium LEGE 06147]|nr:CAP domain-containing protein [Pleurocapsales cyanobacterium LEGE 06147]